MNTLLSLVIGIITLRTIKQRKQKSTNTGLEGIGRIKRRIYKEVAHAQSWNIPLDVKFDELDKVDKMNLETLGKEFYNYKQTRRSIESGKSYAESYFNSLKRAWNAVSGIAGVGATKDYIDHKVRNKEGKVALIWREYQPAIEHLEQEQAVIPDSTEPMPEAEVIVPEPKPTPRKPREKKSKEAERQERYEFAVDFINENAKKFDVLRYEYTNADGTTTRSVDIIADEFENGTLKTKGTFLRNPSVYVKGKWANVTGAPELWEFSKALLQAYKDAQLQSRIDNSDLDAVRIALLDKAKHMTVDVEGELISGNDRYNYLANINWVVVVTASYGRGSEANTYYPIRSFEDIYLANNFAKKYNAERDKDNPNKAKVVNVVDIKTETISGIF